VLPDHGGPSALPQGDAHDLELGTGWARLRRPVRLTLDGIAKGYAVDQAVRTLRRAGVRAGWVNAGGDLRVFGDVAVPLRRREPDGRLRALGALRNGAVATSLTAPAPELSAAFPGRLLGPQGEPAAPGTWTVLAASAWRADALTKVAANTPDAQRAAVIEGLGGRLVELPTPGPDGQAPLTPEVLLP
jgi:thiamine biosynthesis lipoprotein